MNSENDPFMTFTRASPAKRSPKKAIFGSRSPNVSMRTDNFIKPISSPTKFNVVASDWHNENSFYSKPVTSVSQSAIDTHKNSHRPSSPKKTLRKAASTSTVDRFIPARFSTSARINNSLNGAPQPTDSPSKHIAFQSSKIYQHSVAQVCGVSTTSKILQFQPLAPERKQKHTFSLSGTLNEGLTEILQTSRQCSHGIVPSSALARSRNVPSIPTRILDAPGFTDDYYLNLLSWSGENLLAVALENSVYIWQASVGEVNLLTSCECIVTSVSWSEDGSFLSIGKNNGTVEVWDIEDGTKLRTMKVSETRVAAHAWCKHLVSTGSRSGELQHSDVRIADHTVSRITGHHTAEICGIEWRQDGSQLATGGNDNIVNIWDCRSAVPVHSKNTHTAAVKAISWCDYGSSLLATGGGTNDKHIHFWNSSTGARINSINTGSQVTSLHFGNAQGTGLEIVATSGYPNNSIAMYQYPTLQKTGEIRHSHDGRILNSALSPDGTILATAAADENLKFWKVFDLAKNCAQKGVDSSDLANGGKQIRRVMTIR